MISRSWMAGVSALVLLAGCMSADSPTREASPVVVQQAGPATPSEPLANTGALRRERIVTIAMRMTSRHVVDVANSLRASAARVDGYVSHADVNQDDNHWYASINLCIPSASLAEFRRGIPRLAHVDAESENVEDVTDQRIDLDARLRNARAQEQRVLRLLDEHTGTLTEIVTAETELARIRETIERFDAQLAHLDQQTGYATFNITISEPGVEITDDVGPNLGSSALNGLHSAWKVIIATLVGILEAGPVLIIVSIPFVIFVRVWRRRRARSAPLPEPAAVA